MPCFAPQPLTIAAVALVCAGGMPARAQDASAWEAQPHAAARLIAGTVVKSADTAQLRAGIEIRLDPGWKTYWRYPGDSGMPPTLDFTASENVKSVVVLWPAPERFDDGAGGHSIGYRGDVVLPLRISRKDATKPALLQAKLSYAICGALCVPAEANLHLALAGKTGADEPALEMAEARVPRHIAFGAADGLAILSVHRVTDDGQERVVVVVAAPEGTPVDLLVEGPTPDWALPLPEPTASAAGSAPGTHRFAFALDGVPAGARIEGAALTFTAVSPHDAIEVDAHLD